MKLNFIAELPAGGRWKLAVAGDRVMVFDLSGNFPPMLLTDDGQLRVLKPLLVPCPFARGGSRL